MATVVFRLKNMPAVDIANSIEPVVAADREQFGNVTVVAEPISNSIIVTGSQKALEEIEELIEQLDRAPKMVLVQLLIAETRRNPAGKAKTEQAAAAEPRATIAGLPEGSVSTEKLLKALKANDRRPRGGKQGRNKRRQLEVLSRPQIMTLDNQPAFIQLGQREPVIRGVHRSSAGQVNNISYEDTGMTIGVTPRVSPNGRITMEIDFEESRTGSSDTGVPVSVSSDGQTIRAPAVVTTKTQTTISVADGQTIVLGGLRTKSQARQSELLILLTAKIVEDED